MKPQQKFFAKITQSLPKNNSINLDFVDLDFIEKIVHSLAQNLLKFDEPIPNFESRFPNRLEGCLAVIEQAEYFGDDATLQLANLIYRLVKNHPFQNGNKRIALTTMLVIIQINFGFKNFEKFFELIVGNKKELNPRMFGLADFFREIANSKPKEKEKYIKIIYNFSTFIIDIARQSKDRY